MDFEFALTQQWKKKVIFVIDPFFKFMFMFNLQKFLCSTLLLHRLLVTEVLQVDEENKSNLNFFFLFSFLQIYKFSEEKSHDMKSFTRLVHKPTITRLILTTDPQINYISNSVHTNNKYNVMKAKWEKNMWLNCKIENRIPFSLFFLGKSLWC